MEKFLTNKKIIFILVILILIIGIILYKTTNSTYDNLLEENIFVEQSEITSFQTTNQPKIKVHIIGEINVPGLYELEEGSRINDLIILAGGKTENADLNKVNLAYELTDGEQIYIPSIFDEDDEYNYNESISTTSSGKINLNKATEQDLQTISGIGPGLAQKIISYRNSIGKFSSIEELKNVSGIGDKKFESIKDFVSLK